MDSGFCAEARHYAALSDAERDALWNEGAEILDAEDDELELPAPLMLRWR
jgi:hypothetical protein